MKHKFFIMFVMLILFSASLCLAGGLMICHYPKSCSEIVSTEYSTGAGKSTIQYVELDCIQQNGKYVKYIDRVVKPSALLGLGRITNPDKILFEQWDKDELVCKEK